MRARDDIWFRLKFHPVGQGLCISGAMCRRSKDREMLRWIYDCGTTSSQSLVQAALTELAWKGMLFPELNNSVELVTISHFDKDHISGLEQLIHQRQIGTLLLPYAPLWSRIAAQFEAGLSTEDSAFGAIVDPVSYIRSIDGGERIERILFVPPAGATTPPVPETDDDPDTPGPEGEPEGEFATRPKLSIDDALPTEEQAVELALGQRTESETGVAVLQPGGRLLVDKYWEWVPYNDAELKPRSFDSFSAEVERLRGKLLASGVRVRAGMSLSTEVTKALNELKGHYDRSIGKSAKKRNLISLFLYGGPVKLARWEWFYGTTGKRLDFPCQLFTGDGYLNCPARVDALEAFLGSRRLEHVGVLQVMHHGARDNWHPGVAERLAPQMSVFSSDPAHKGLGHPHAEVLRDFWPYGAIQVDQKFSAYVERWP